MRIGLTKTVLKGILLKLALSSGGNKIYRVLVTNEGKMVCLCSGDAIGAIGVCIGVTGR
jgi:hypothetical protein